MIGSMKKGPNLKRLETKHPRVEEIGDELAEIGDIVDDKIQHKKDSYLPQGKAEPEDAYELRKTLARFKSETIPMLRRAASRVFAIPPSRPKQLAETHKKLIEDADGTDIDLDTYMEDTLFEALAFGASLVLVDRPQTVIEQDGEGEDATRRDTGRVEEPTSKGFADDVEVHDREPGEVFLIRYRLSQVVNWATDRRGELHWIRIYDPEVRQPTPDAEPEVVEVYWEWDRASWRKWKVVEKEDSEKGGKIKEAEIEDDGDHFLGIVPLAICAPYRRGTRFEFDSAIRYSYHWDIEAFQDWTDIRYDTFMHAHPTKYRRTMKDKQDLQPIGPNSEILLDGADEEAGYLEYPAVATEQLRANVDAQIAGARRAAGIDPLGTSDEPEALGASGRARVAAFSMGEKPILQRYTRAVRACETRIFEIAERWDSNETDLGAYDRLVEEAPAYSKRFDIADPMEMITAWSETRREINSERLDREVQKVIATALLPDAPPDVREEILQEIDKKPLIGLEVGLDPKTGGPASPEDAAASIDELEDLNAKDLDDDDDE